MALSDGSAQYYIHRGGFSGSDPGNQTAGLHSPPEFRQFSNSGIPSQPNPRSVGTAFSVGPSQENYSLAINAGASAGAPASEPVKKKIFMGLSRMSVNSNKNSGSNSENPKRARGRLPGSGRKQQLALLGMDEQFSRGKLLCHIS